MNTETTQEERRSALDDFAQTAIREMPAETLPAVTAAPSDLVHGAQKIAVYRDERRVFERLRAGAAAAGENWYYRWPVKNRRTGTTDYVEGPSIKLANDLARLYGNCDIDVRVQDFGDTWLFTARFIDLETGFSLTRPFQQRKAGVSKMGDDAARQLDITFQIGASKAIRNVTVNALQTFADFALEEAKSAIVTKIGKDVNGWRAKTVSALQRENVGLTRVEAVIGRTASKWLAPDIARIIAMMNSVLDGMATIDETFPPLEKDVKGQATVELDAFAGSASSSPEDAETASAGTTGDVNRDASMDPALADLIRKQANDAVNGILRVATNASLSAEQKEEQLANAWLPDDLTSHAPSFCRTLMRTAADVALDRMKHQDARDYLLSLKIGG